MEVVQIYNLMNDVTKELLGKTGVISEDLSNVVDAGVEIFNSAAVDAYVKTLVNHIGKVIFVNRPYSGALPSVMMDSWEFGSVVEKIQADIPEAQENESWELVNGTSYDPNIFYKPSVSAKFFNKKVTFEVPMSFTEMQVKQSFSSAAQLNGFLSMIYNAVDKSMTIKIDSLVMRTINNMIGMTVHDAFPAGTYTGTAVRAINLLKLYNDTFSASLTADKCLTDAEFNRFAAYQIGLYIDRLSRLSTLFNIGGKERFTSKDMLHLILLSDFAKASNAYLQSEVYHNDLTSLPSHETVPYWQASGQNYSFADVSKISIKTSENDTVEFGGILGVMFDRDALGVSNLSRRVTTNYNAKAEFYNNFYKFDAGYFNDTNENFLVFYVA